MNDSSKTLVGAIAGMVAVVACFAIMAQCSETIETTDARISDCAKAGGHWHYNGSLSFCERADK